MIWKLLQNTLIKWWYVVYVPIVRKIWPTKEEKDLYEEEHPDEIQEKIPLTTAEPPSIDSSVPESSFQNTANQTNPQNLYDPMIHNENYNATTHSMSGEYGKGPLDDDAKAQLDAILKSNYNATNSIPIDTSFSVPDSVIPTEPACPEPEPEETEVYGSDLSQEEEDDAMEQLRQAEEIYERLRREAAEDEAKKQAAIDAAKNNAI